MTHSPDQSIKDHIMVPTWAIFIGIFYNTKFILHPQRSFICSGDCSVILVSVCGTVQFHQLGGILVETLIHMAFVQNEAMAIRTMTWMMEWRPLSAVRYSWVCSIGSRRRERCRWASGAHYWRGGMKEDTEDTKVWVVPSHITGGRNRRICWKQLLGLFHNVFGHPYPGNSVPRKRLYARLLYDLQVPTIAFSNLLQPYRSPLDCGGGIRSFDKVLIVLTTSK